MPMVRRAVRVVDDDEEAAAHELHHAEPAKLTVEELDAALDQADELDAALEKALDLDGDGVVSNEEFVQAYDADGNFLGPFDSFNPKRVSNGASRAGWEPSGGGGEGDGDRLAQGGAAGTARRPRLCPN